MIITPRPRLARSVKIVGVLPTRRLVAVVCILGALTGCTPAALPPESPAATTDTRAEAVMRIVRDTMAQAHLRAVIVRATQDAEEICPQCACITVAPTAAAPFAEGASSPQARVRAISLRSPRWCSEHEFGGVEQRAGQTSSSAGRCSHQSRARTTAQPTRPADGISRSVLRERTEARSGRSIPTWQRPRSSPTRPVRALKRGGLRPPRRRRCSKRG
jgi:hypothetical protein